MTITEISVAGAKARLSAVLQQVEAGQEVVITRRGQPVVRMTAIAPALRPMDFTRIDRLRARQKRATAPSARWLRQLRDQARY